MEVRRNAGEVDLCNNFVCCVDLLSGPCGRLEGRRGCDLWYWTILRSLTLFQLWLSLSLLACIGGRIRRGSVAIARSTALKIERTTFEFVKVLIVGALGNGRCLVWNDIAVLAKAKRIGLMQSISADACSSLRAAFGVNIWLKSSGELTTLLTSEDTSSVVAVGMPKRRRKKNAPKKWRKNDDGVGEDQVVGIDDTPVDARLNREKKERQRVEVAEQEQNVSDRWNEERHGRC